MNFSSWFECENTEVSPRFNESLAENAASRRCWIHQPYVESRCFNIYTQAGMGTAAHQSPPALVAEFDLLEVKLLDI